MHVHQRIGSIPLMAIVAIAVGACAAPPSTDSELVLTDIYTSVALTVAAATDAVTPTATLPATSTPFPTITQFPASSATATSYASYDSYASGCDNAAYASDVTISDGTELAPGATFTKTWQFLNTGSCDWGKSYSITFVSGSDLDGATTKLGQTVGVGSYGEISVSLTAPDNEGTYTGYWRLANASGDAFGEQVYVQIVVTGDAVTNTPTPTSEDATPTSTTALEASETPAEAVTSTPEVILSPTPEAATT